MPLSRWKIKSLFILLQAWLVEPVQRASVFFKYFWYRIITDSKPAAYLHFRHVLSDLSLLDFPDHKNPWGNGGWILV